LAPLAISTPHKSSKVSLGRGADDVQPALEAFMAERGLAFSHQRTAITHAHHG
jgi:hypothetical protein